MTPPNGSKATIREVYELVTGLERRQSQDRSDMERRLVETITSATGGLENRVLEQLRCHAHDIEVLQGGVGDLRIADRKWGGVTAIIAAAFTGIGTAFGVYLKK